VYKEISTNYCKLNQMTDDTIAFKIAEELFDIEHASSKQQPWQNH